MRKFFVSCVLLVMLTGCQMMPVSKLAGFSEPCLRIKKDARGGYEVYTSADFKGKGEIKVNKETGDIDISFNITTSATDVTQAQGERAQYLTELRKIEAEDRLAQMQIMKVTVEALASALKPIPVVP